MFQLYPTLIFILLPRDIKGSRVHVEELFQYLGIEHNAKTYIRKKACGTIFVDGIQSPC